MAHFRGGTTRDWRRPLTFLLLAVTIATATSPAPCKITKVDEEGQHVECTNFATIDIMISSLEQLNAQPVYLYNSYIPAVPTPEQMQNPVFAKLEGLDVRHCGIPVFPSDIAILIPKLRLLNFPYNEMTAIEDKTYAGLNLTTLGLGNNQISVVTEGAFRSPTLAKLRRIALDNNKIAELPATVFRGLHDLKILFLKSNELAVLDENLFEGLNSLEVLVVSDNKLSSFGLKTFANVPNLKSLDASDNQLQSIDTKLFESNSKLIHLDLSNNRLSNLGEVFLNIPSLTEINLGNNNIERLTPNPFLLTPNLVVVNLKDNKLNGTSTTDFQALRQLKLVNLSKNKISSQAIEAFRERESDSARYTVIGSMQAVNCTSPEIVELRNWLVQGGFSFYQHVICG